MYIQKYYCIFVKNTNMKTISIGDLHGKDEWKNALNYWRPDDEDTYIDQYDKIIFVGDYVDSFDIPDNNILKNLQEIIELKIKYPEKVVLLWGNHEIQYLFGTKRYGCSGYRPSMWLSLNTLFKEYRNLFQLAFQIENYIWTHAGITSEWFDLNINEKTHIVRDNKYITNLPIDKLDNISDILNFCFEAGHQHIFDCSPYVTGGSDRTSGPLWASKYETRNLPLIGYHQIVGHTHVDEIKHYENYKDKNTSMTYIDCVSIENDNYYIIEILN